MKKIKKLFLSIIFLASFGVANAQEICCDPNNNLITNGNFNAATCGGNNAFSNNCVPGWANEGGTASISNFPSNSNAWMWSYGGGGEAISAPMNFQRGVTYNICFRIRTDDRNSGDPNVANNAIVNLIATNNAGPVTPNPSGDPIFQNTMGAYLNTWTNINVQFTPDNNYSRLWIFPYMANPSNGVSQAEMNIDDVVISLANVTPIFTMKDEYCEDDPILPIAVPSGLMSYRWLIHDVTNGGNVLKHATLGISGNVNLIDFRSLWNGFQAGRTYTVTFEYWDACGIKHIIKRKFNITKKEVHTSCVDLACGEPFDPNTISFPDTCEGDIVGIEDLVSQVSYLPTAPIYFQENTVLKVIYECCELFLCVNVTKEDEVIIKEVCPEEEGRIVMEACGGTDGYYSYIINGVGESSTQSSQVVDYVPGGEYSVTFISETGCSCTVIYKVVCDEWARTEKKASDQLNGTSEKPSNFVIYPNPSNGNYSIQPNFKTAVNEKAYEITITNIAGKSIFTKETIPLNRSYHLDITNYTAGIYFLKITVGNTTEVKKLIKN
ncbi:T9SS type A sorting domain-containing protein [Kordia jejudonensis]|uniref:T9SS type A sorting domain-containing protein n=1 Tax=Kordia jejudonensis TaxID=1348245 RepID=UPI00062961F9|nr:T9SS type A sorting domain-containing protein [Kordia jejudonensis]